MLLNMHDNLENMRNRSHNYSTIDVETQFWKKIKSLVAWSISEGRMDQKQIINFVRPNLNGTNFCNKCDEISVVIMWIIILLSHIIYAKSPLYYGLFIVRMSVIGKR